jgi:hypothetical protein
MKKSILWSCLGVVLLALSGCEDVANRERDPIAEVEPESYQELGLRDLKDGVIVSGENLAGNSVVLSFCLYRYEYTTNKRAFYGSYGIASDRIKFSDETPTGGSYHIDTITSTLEVGQLYEITARDDQILVSEILQDLECD